MDDETEVYKQTQEEIDREDQKINQLKLHAKVLDGKVASLKTYEKFLQDVVAKNQDQYSDIGELLIRHFTLKKSNDQLEIGRNRMESEQKNLKGQMNDFEKEHSNKVLLLNNEINALQKHLEVRADSV